MSAVPVHTAIATTISPWVIDRIDKRRRAFLWKGAATVSGGAMSPRVAEGLPADHRNWAGGLGFPNLEFMGYALKLRWLWLRKIDPHRPWAMLPDMVEKQVQDVFHFSTYIIVGDGSSTLFSSGFIAGCRGCRA
jgi:hypothetical protein